MLVLGDLPKIRGACCYTKGRICEYSSQRWNMRASEWPVNTRSLMAIAVIVVAYTGTCYFLKIQSVFGEIIISRQDWLLESLCLWSLAWMLLLPIRFVTNQSCPPWPYVVIIACAPVVAGAIASCEALIIGIETGLWPCNDWLRLMLMASPLFMGFLSGICLLFMATWSGKGSKRGRS